MLMVIILYALALKAAKACLQDLANEQDTQRPNFTYYTAHYSM